MYVYPNQNKLKLNGIQQQNFRNCITVMLIPLRTKTNAFSFVFTKESSKVFEGDLKLKTVILLNTKVVAADITILRVNEFFQ